MSVMLEIGHIYNRHLESLLQLLSQVLSSQPHLQFKIDFKYDLSYEFFRKYKCNLNWLNKYKLLYRRRNTCYCPPSPNEMRICYVNIVNIIITTWLMKTWSRKTSRADLRRIIFISVAPFCRRQGISERCVAFIQNISRNMPNNKTTLRPIRHQKE